MGRKRKNADPLRPLPRGLNLRPESGVYRTRNIDGSYTTFGRDYDAACKAYRLHICDATRAERVTTKWLLEWYLQTILPTRGLAKATVAAYNADSATLIHHLGHIPYSALTTALLADYRNARGNIPHVTKELAVLSNAYRFAIDAGMATSNPVTAVIKHATQKRTRLLSDDEYLKIYNAAPQVLGAHPAKMLQRAMRLALRTLQRPADVLKMHSQHIQNGLLCFRQSKTGESLRIKIEGDLAALIAECPNIGYLIHTDRPTKGKPAGSPYEVKGVSGMWWKVASAAGVKDCGLEDLRAKGATDMYNDGKPISEIRALLGHTTEATTRVYLKEYAPVAVGANLRAVAA